MDRSWFEQRLLEGASIAAIASDRGLDASTVYYWVKKHGLRAPHAHKHAPRGPVDEATLRDLVDQGRTVKQIAEAVDRGPSSVRHWLRRYGLQTERQVTYSPRGELPRELWRDCRHHGLTRFVRVGKRTHYRCARCGVERVSERRRQVKRALIQEAGGRCVICGYDRYAGALQFHHLDPSEKTFAISLNGSTRGLDRLRDEARKC